MSDQPESTAIDINGILKILPHRYPFVMVDRVLSWESKESITALKNVTINEPFFVGHFPREPVMPGVLIVEGLAQVGALLAYNSMIDIIGDKLVFFASMDKVKFRKKVEPGDQIILEVKAVRMGSKACKMKGVAYVDGEIAVEAELMAVFK